MENSGFMGKHYNSIKRKI